MLSAQTGAVQLSGRWLFITGGINDSVDTRGSALSSHPHRCDPNSRCGGWLILTSNSTDYVRADGIRVKRKHTRIYAITRYGEAATAAGRPTTQLTFWMQR